MSKRSLDLDAIKQARENLDRIARENPHLIDYSRAQWSGEDIAAMVADPSKTTFTVDEAAEFLNCHPQTLRRAIRNGLLRAAKVGKAFTISRSDLQAYYQAKGGGHLFGDDAER